MKEKFKTILIIAGISVVVIFGIFFASCEKGNMTFSKKGVFEEATYSDMVLSESAPMRSSKSMMLANGINSASGSLDMSNMNLEESGEGQERKIIKTGSLSFEVKNLSETEELISAWIEDFGGYVSNTWTNRNNMNITVKVPSTKFEEAIGSKCKGN